ncbi:MAG: peptidase MA family metallohydrolase [Fidelibacterota bacterium]
MKSIIKWILISIGGIIFLLGIVFLWSDYSKALFKSRDHFIVHPTDSRIRYEPGAKDYADSLAFDLVSAISKVEEIHGVPFKKDFTVYMCESQKSLNEFVAQPAALPVRGLVLFGDIFVAPSAFHWLNDEDTHRGTLRHELSHLLTKQYLGEMRNRTTLPVWFMEGLADVACDCAGEGVSDEIAKRAIKSGDRILLDTKSSLFHVKRATDYGFSYPMFHRQSRLLVGFLHDHFGMDFQAFVKDLHRGSSFEDALGTRLGLSTDRLWDVYMSNL